MPHSRLSRLEDRKEKRRLILAITGILAIFILIGLFGVKALIGFSLLVEKTKGTAPTPTPNRSVILPPTLDPPPEATNTATIPITGKGQKGLTVILFVNDSEFNKVTVADDGTFVFKSVPIDAGANTVNAKVTDDKGNTSDVSNTITVTYTNTPPKLIVSDPTDGATITGDPNTVTVDGQTDDNVTVTVNDRVVVVKTDNTFSYSYPLQDGDNTLTIVATDAAGNQTKIIRKVTYHH